MKYHGRAIKFAGIFAAVLAVLLCAVIFHANAGEKAGEKVPLTADALASVECINLSTIEFYANTIEAQNAVLTSMDQGLDNIATVITFAQYLTFDEFQQFVDTYDITISQLQLRGFWEDGTRVSVFSRTDAGLTAVEAMIIEEANSAGFTLAGITGVNAYVDSDQLAAIAADELVYLADTSGDLNVQAALAAPSLQQNGTNTATVSGAGFPKSLTWELEDLGLME